jgi:manganese transport protein
MTDFHQPSLSAKTVTSADAVLDGKKGSSLKRFLPFLGPAFIASIAYVDPGNFATNIQAGSGFGYLLLWVIVASNLMAMVLQSLAAKLGIASGKNLAEQCRESFPAPVTLIMWMIMETAAMATDLAEFLGAAIGFQMLFGMPLLAGGFITAIITFLLLGIERYGFRPMEVLISAFVGIIALCYLLEMFLVRPQWGDVLSGALTPRFMGSESVLLAAGILGATVMPHAIFLHSALTKGRIVSTDPLRLKKLFRFEITDVCIAMGIAGLVNMAILIMAAATFHRHGLNDVATLEQAHLTLRPLLGWAASGMFGLSLLASGLASSTVGTAAGQIIMQGFLRRHIPVWLRRMVTMVPSLVVIAIGFDPTRTLVLSQVVLSFALPFAVIPLVLFTARRSIMGVLVNKPLTTVSASLCAVIILGLNGFLLFKMIGR